MTGVVFHIQKFSVHDGPGIRTTVFLKGCPLKCPWCSNPESQNFFPELLLRNINCRGCGACVEVCPQKAITVTTSNGRIINRNQCNLCLKCVQSCLYRALVQCGQSMTVTEVIDEILKDKIFYNHSGGGVTLSGGEPLSQPAFTKQILEACKKEDLHTAIETTGVGYWKDLEDILRFTDLILFDIKHLDSKRHKQTTGVSNIRILENLQKAARLKPVWLRLPLIARFNDSESHIQQIAQLGLNIGAQKISLLPYHEGGKTKSAQLGIAYRYPQGKAPGEKRIEKIKQIIEKTGLHASVGS